MLRTFGLSLVLLLSILNINHAKADIFDGREYQIYIPKGYIKGTVFVLHGGKSDGDRIRKLTQFDRLADQYNVAVVYPSSPDKFWNDGRSATLSSDASRDDGLYLSSLVNHLYQRKIIPSNQAYFTGISNGGGMSMYMACRFPEKTAGISVIATKLPTSLDCSNYKAVPTLFFHGDKDRVSPHAGRSAGDEGIVGKDAGTNYSSQVTALKWSQLNKCAGKPLQIKKNTVPNDGTSIAGYKFRNCASPLEYYVIEGGGHTWPGALEPDVNGIVKRLLGKTSKEMDAGAQSLRVWLRL